MRTSPLLLLALAGCAAPSLTPTDTADTATHGLTLSSPGGLGEFDGQHFQITLGNRPVGLGLDQIGRDQALRPTAPFGARNAEDADALRLDHGAIEERWEAVPEGFEHSFVVAEKAPGTGALRLHVAVDGAVPYLDPADPDTVLIDAPGTDDDAKYSGLRAWDADGSELTSRFVVNGTSILLEVEDSRARYPITVDPVYSSTYWTYTEYVTAKVGQAVAVGRFNGDAFDDVATSNPIHSSNAGKVMAWYGSSSGLSTASTPPWMPTSVAAGNYLGASLAAVDTNGDGFDDLVIGAPGYGATSPYIGGQASEGALYIAMGSASGLGETFTIIESNQTNYQFGTFLLNAGRFNNDIYEDVLVGSPVADGAGGTPGDVGHIALYLGSSSGLSATAAWSYLGTGIGQQTGTNAAVFDPNNDGFPDIAVSQPSYGNGQGQEGRILVFMNNAGTLPSTPTLTNLESNVASTQWSIGAAADVNDDDFDDVVIVSRQNSITVIYGSATGLDGGRARQTFSITSDTTTCYGSWNESCELGVNAGDIGGDASEDVFLRLGDTMGLYFGSSSGLSTASVWSRQAANTAYGKRITISERGNVNGDTIPDFVIGDPTYSTLNGSGQSYNPGRVQQISFANDIDGDAKYGVDDCDETSVFTYVGAAERCDGEDNDCDGSIDEGLATTTQYPDTDGDTYGDKNATGTPKCTPVASWASGFVANNTDCDDTLASVKPGGTEVCNDRDDDCDGSTDEGLETTYYRDADNDTFGNATNTTAVCATDPMPAGYVANDDDCNDGSSAIRPTATEVCDAGNVDENCNNVADDADTLTPATGKTTFYADTDGDTYGNASSTAQYCDKPAAWSTNATDCDDTDAGDYPGAPETTGNEDDEDCNGGEVCFQDTDRDGARNSTLTVASGDRFCTTAASEARAAQSIDCNDGSASFYPGAPELCDGADNDCDAAIDESLPTSPYYTDTDADGYGASTAAAVSLCGPFTGFASNNSDCDDTTSTRRPGITETCDSVDQDCDGLIDEGLRTNYYADDDTDGYGDPADAVNTCTAAGAPSGRVANNTDCDDNRNTVNPGAPEICDASNRDENCNNLADDNDTLTPATGRTTYFVDTDNDGFGNLATSAAYCDKPSGWSAVSTDCDDTDAGDYPSATEIIGNEDDEDCSGGDTCFRDEDRDGARNSTLTVVSADRFCTTSASEARSVQPIDCVDTTADTYPGAPELCDGVDNDCDSAIDDGLSTSPFYTDADADGYGASTATAVSLCGPFAGFASNNGDCDDTTAARRPGTTETCDSIDNDCDTLVDEGLRTNYYADDDTDGYGDPTDGVSTCTAGGAPPGRVVDNSDCDDTRAAVNPGATEICDVDNRDENCNDLADDDDGGVAAASRTLTYVDADGDGYGKSGASVAYCDIPTGRSTVATDCDDLSADDRPGATEIVGNEDDENCDGKEVCHVDADRDTFRTSATVLSPDLLCTTSFGEATFSASIDCDDTAVLAYPGATEVPYDGVDQDCSGGDLVDLDGDGAIREGFGGTDCNDNNAEVRPGKPEIANGLDDDCDGAIDEGTDRADDDGDGRTELGGDCADDDPTIPGVERCNDIDDDCDGQIDEGTACSDDDEDTFTEAEGDCNDANSAIAPGATERRNGIDDDCDGAIDEGFLDLDSDGFSTEQGDCADDDAARYPGATEVADGVDQDCDGTVDEGTAGFDDDDDGYSEADGDCDDRNGYVAPNMPEVADLLDNDCNGEVDDIASAEGEGGGSSSGDETSSGGCSSGGTAPSLASAVFGLVLLRRRRAPTAGAHRC